MLYEPAVLLLAIVVLARTRGLPERLLGLSATVFASSAAIAAVYVWPQVYLGGFRYLTCSTRTRAVRSTGRFSPTGSTSRAGSGR